LKFVAIIGFILLGAITYGSFFYGKFKSYNIINNFINPEKTPYAIKIDRLVGEGINYILNRSENFPGKFGKI
jgi:hypothetical protein